MKDAFGKNDKLARLILALRSGAFGSWEGWNLVVERRLLSSGLFIDKHRAVTFVPPLSQSGAPPAILPEPRVIQRILYPTNVCSMENFVQITFTKSDY